MAFQTRGKYNEVLENCRQIRDTMRCAGRGSALPSSSVTQTLTDAYTHVIYPVSSRFRELPPSSSKWLNYLNGRRCTPGVRIPVEHLRSPSWTSYFRKQLQSRGWTAPLFRCPFCVSTTPQETEARAVWRTPLNAMAHLSHEHMHEGAGWKPSPLTDFNQSVLQALIHRLGAEEDPGQCVGRISASGGAATTRLRLLVWIDVANVDLSNSSVLLDMLQSPSLRPILQHVPIGWCCTHELFIPHTCATLHGAFQLSCCHPHSDLFTFYAPTRAESGDLLTSALISSLRTAMGRDTPPIILLTRDAVQRRCAADLFGAVTPFAVSSNAMYHAILQALGDGIGE